MPLEDKGVVITGAGRGIGRSVALALGGAGASVVLAARTSEEIELVSIALMDLGVRALPVTCDVGDPTSVSDLVETAIGFLGQVDILVNNAGTAGSAPIQRETLDNWNRTFAVNVTSAFLSTKAVLPGMLVNGWGRIINVASVAGLSGARYISAYSSSKHAMIGLTRCAAAEVAELGVTVNAICPGFVDTEMTAITVKRVMQRSGLDMDEAIASILKTTGQHRLISPDEVAHAVLSLCDERAGGINGQTIVIDGGGLLS